jgi:septal ring factor EnvC (AmiA/AmiB activator)
MCEPENKAKRNRHIQGGSTMKYIAMLLALVILATGLLTGCGISKESYDAAVKEANDLSAQLSSVQADLATAQDNLSQCNSDLATALQNLNTVTGDRDSILAQLNDAEAELTATQDQLDSANSQVASLQSQLASLQDQIAPLQSQNSQLQQIIDLSLSSTKAEAVPIYQTYGVYSNVVSFTAQYAGYVVVSGTSTSVNGYIYVEDSFTGYPYDNYLHYFVSGATLIIPVLPGTVSVYFTNTDPAGATAILTVKYYY